MGETPTGPIGLCSALWPVTADAITCAAIGMIEGGCAHQPDRTNSQMTTTASGGRGTVTEAGTAPVPLRRALHSVTALAIARSGNRMVEGQCSDRTVRTSAGMTTGTVCRRGCVRERTVAPPDSRTVMTACAITTAAGVVGKAIDDRSRALCRMTFCTAAGVRFVGVGSANPGHSGAANVAGRAIADARIGVKHLVHKRGGLRRRMTVETRCGRWRVAEGSKESPACSAGRMTLPAILAAAVNDGSTGRGIDDRRGPVKSMAVQATHVGERGVIRNNRFSRRVHWLR